DRQGHRRRADERVRTRLHDRAEGRRRARDLPHAGRAGRAHCGSGIADEGGGVKSAVRTCRRTARSAEAASQSRSGEGIVIEWTKAALLELQEYLRLVAATSRALVTRPYYFRDIVEQFQAIGLGSMTVVLLTGTFTGMVLALQSGITLDQFGARSMVGRLLSASMVKEL